MSINVFTASGNIGRDCEVRFTPNNKAIGNFPLPVKSGYGDNEKVAWVDCKILGDRAQSISPYLTKGAKVTISGAFQLEEWEKDGVKHSKPVIIVNSIEFGSAQQGQQRPVQQQSNQQRPAQNNQQAQQMPAQNYQQVQANYSQQQQQGGDEWDDSEILF